MFHSGSYWESDCWTQTQADEQAIVVRSCKCVSDGRERQCVLMCTKKVQLAGILLGTNFCGAEDGTGYQ